MGLIRRWTRSPGHLTQRGQHKRSLHSAHYRAYTNQIHQKLWRRRCARYTSSQTRRAQDTRRSVVARKSLIVAPVERQRRGARRAHHRHIHRQTEGIQNARNHRGRMDQVDPCGRWRSGTVQSRPRGNHTSGNRETHARQTAAGLAHRASPLLRRGRSRSDRAPIGAGRPARAGAADRRMRHAPPRPTGQGSCPPRNSITSDNRPQRQGGAGTNYPAY